MLTIALESKEPIVVATTTYDLAWIYVLQGDQRLANETWIRHRNLPEAYQLELDSLPSIMDRALKETSSELSVES